MSSGNVTVMGEPVFTMTVFTNGIVTLDAHKMPPGGDLNGAVQEGLRQIVLAMEAGELTFDQMRV